MAGIRMENKIYEVGMYCRLSKDDGTDNESASIATQKSILTDYVKKQGWHLAKTYVDDGYSGTNFQRPSFQNMIKDIESGVITALSRKIYHVWGGITLTADCIWKSFSQSIT